MPSPLKFLCLATAAALLTAPVTSASGQPAPGPRPGQAQTLPDAERWMADLSPGLRQSIRDALRRGGEGDFRAALEGLRPIRDGRPLPWQVHLAIAGLFERLDQYPEAVAIYQTLLAALGEGAASLSENLELFLGSALARLGRDEEAIVHLQRAWRHPGAIDDNLTYHLLGSVYLRRGMRDLALSAFALAFAADPGDRLAREMLQAPGAGVPPSASGDGRLPAHPDAAGALRLAAGAELSAIGENELPQASARHIEYGNVLEAGGWPDAARNHRLAIIGAGLSPFLENCLANRHEECLQDLAASARRPVYERLPHEVHAEALRLEIRAHLALQHFMHAASAFQRFSQVPGLSREEIEFRGNRLASQIFAAISFDPLSGAPRYSDPADFLSQQWTTCLAINAVSEGPDADCNSATAGRDSHGDHPYGEVSASEDSAETSTAIFTAGRHREVRLAVASLVRARIRQRNLELPVKLSLHWLVSGFLDHPVPGDRETLRSLLDEEMAREADPPIPAVTQDAYFAGKIIASVLGPRPWRPAPVR